MTSHVDLMTSHGDLKEERRMTPKHFEVQVLRMRKQVPRVDVTSYDGVTSYEVVILNATKIIFDKSRNKIRRP